MYPNYLLCISTYFKEIWNFVGCRENLREKLHEVGSFLESVRIFYNLSSDQYKFAWNFLHKVTHAAVLLDDTGLPDLNYSKHPNS